MSGRDSTRNLLHGSAGGVVLQAGRITDGVHIHQQGMQPAQPRELPVDVTVVGRQKYLAELDAFLTSKETRIVVVSGTGGVGKTAFAVHWSHRVRERFPDGQLYVDLCGYGPDRSLMAADVLARFLRQLGDRKIPHELAERSARFRSLTFDRRLLIVLDNAGSASQIRPLLPGGSSCFTLVTSRDALAGTVIRDGAYRMELDLLGTSDALALMRMLVGIRIDTERHAAEELVNYCSRLPLALRLAAELITLRPAVDIADLASELAEQQRRLDLLDSSGDPATAVRAVFSWSYCQLAEGEARLFRRLGLSPVREIDADAAAALGGTDADIKRNIEGLLRAHLIEEYVAGRYRMHDLLRSYASELATELDAEVDRRAALASLLDHYLSASSAASRAAAPLIGQSHHWSSSETSLVAFEDPYDALGWLDRERKNIIVVVRFASQAGWAKFVTAMSRIMDHYFNVCSYYDESVSLHDLALSAARECGERDIEAFELARLGAACWISGQFSEALEIQVEALAIAQDIGDQELMCAVLNSLGLAYMSLGNFEKSLGYLERTLALAIAIDSRTIRDRALCNMATLYIRVGLISKAIEFLECALGVDRTFQDPTIRGNALVNLAFARALLEQYSVAMECLDETLAIAQLINNRTLRGYGLSCAGYVKTQLCEFDRALEHLDAAVALGRELGNRSLEAHALNNLGRTASAMDKPTQARNYFQEALAIAGKAGNLYEEAKANHGLGDVYSTMAQHSDAVKHWQRALALHRSMGTPEVAQISFSLAST